LTSFAEGLGLRGVSDATVLAFFAHGQPRKGWRIRPSKGDSLVIGSTAVIDGPVRFEGHKQPEVSSSQKLASPIEFKYFEKKQEYRETTTTSGE